MHNSQDYYYDRKLCRFTLFPWAFFPPIMLKIPSIVYCSLTPKDNYFVSALWTTSDESVWSWTSFSVQFFWSGLSAHAHAHMQNKCKNVCKQWIKEIRTQTHTHTHKQICRVGKKRSTNTLLLSWIWFCLNLYFTRAYLLLTTAHFYSLQLQIFLFLHRQNMLVALVLQILLKVITFFFFFLCRRSTIVVVLSSWIKKCIILYIRGRYSGVIKMKTSNNEWLIINITEYWIEIG